MSFIPLAQDQHRCRVATDRADPQHLARYLSKSKRPMAALLNRQRMECLADGRFLYRSRPFRLLRYEIRPEVVFSTTWSDQALRIVFQQCRIHGLGAIERAIEFRCEAVLQPCADGLEAQAWAAVQMDADHPMAALPLALRRRLAHQALRLVFERLERRCRGGLQRSLKSWLEAEACVRNDSECE